MSSEKPPTDLDQLREWVAAAQGWAAKMAEEFTGLLEVLDRARDNPRDPTIGPALNIQGERINQLLGPGSVVHTISGVVATAPWHAN